MDIHRQLINSPGISIAAHKRNTGDVVAKLVNKRINGIRIERKADILPQVMAMAARTMTRAVGNINGQRHLVRYFLKDNAGIDVFQHGSPCTLANGFRLNMTRKIGRIKRICPLPRRHPTIRFIRPILRLKDYASSFTVYFCCEA